jgi:hypothetical protein
MKAAVLDPALVARCGLYCGACRSYRRGRCPGCRENEKAGWCKIRACCAEHGYTTCADCREFTNPNDCGKFNNVFAKVFALVLRSDRAACVAQIRELGLEGHARAMAAGGRQTIRRGRRS